MTTPGQERRAIVTGAASGMGAALATALVQDGATVLGLDRDGEGLRRTASSLDPDRFRTETIDLTDREALSRSIEAFASEPGGLDLLFNNAGIVAGGEYADMEVAQVDRMIAVNLMAVMHASRVACRIMRARGRGHIVNTASSAGVMPVPWSAAYTASKHGVVGFSLALRREAAAYGVRVSVVCPGLVDTGIFAAAHDIEGYDYRAVVEAMPLSRISPEAAARSILAGVRRNRARIVFPAVNRWILRLHRCFPGVIEFFSARQLRGHPRPDRENPDPRAPNLQD